jgi:hypothetical protein
MTGEDPTVWRKGWLYPALAAPICLAAGVLFVVGAAEVGGSSLWLILVGLVFLVLGAGAVATAVRRKLTMTGDTLVVRTLFRTAVLPLAEVTEVYRGIGDNGLLAVKSVCVRTTTTSITTKSFGTHQKEGIRLIADAAIAQGAQVLDWNAEREPRPPGR